MTEREKLYLVGTICFETLKETLQHIAESNSAVEDCAVKIQDLMRAYEQNRPDEEKVDTMKQVFGSLQTIIDKHDALVTLCREQGVKLDTLRNASDDPSLPNFETPDREFLM